MRTKLRTAEQARAYAYGRPLDGYERVRDPVKCPSCGARSVIVPCLECAALAEKRRQRLSAVGLAAAGESGWEN